MILMILMIILRHLSFLSVFRVISDTDGMGVSPSWPKKGRWPLGNPKKSSSTDHVYLFNSKVCQLTSPILD